MNEQLSEDDDIAAAQMLSMGATRYAGELIKAATGDPQHGSNVLKALVRARLSAAVSLAVPVVSALRDLQEVAILFTVQLATSNDECDPEGLQQIEEKLVAMLEKQDTTRLHSHDCTSSAQRLGDCALDYMHQIVLAEDNHAPIGSDAVGRAITELHIAAVVFTTQLAIAASYDPTPLRRIEDKLVAALAGYGGS